MFPGTEKGTEQMKREDKQWKTSCPGPTCFGKCEGSTNQPMLTCLHAVVLGNERGSCINKW